MREKSRCWKGFHAFETSWIRCVGRGEEEHAERRGDSGGHDGGVIESAIGVVAACTSWDIQCAMMILVDAMRALL